MPAHRPSDEGNLLPRVIMACVAALMLAVSLGCSRQKPLIYVVPRTTATLFWESLHNGALQAARQNGYRVYWNAATREDDVGRQLGLLEQARERRPAGLIVAPSHGPALLTEMRDLLRSGMPTVVVESSLPLPSGPYLTYVVTDHTAAVRALVQRLRALSPQPPQVAVVGIDPDIPSDRDLLSGLAEELARNGAGRIVSRQFSRFNRQQTEEQVETLLKTRPNIDAVLALNPAAMAGALDALRRVSVPRKVHLFGCQQDLAQIDALRSGEIDGVIVQDMYREGQLGAEAIIERRRTGHWPAEISVPSRLVSGQDFKDPAVMRIFSLAPRSVE